ncbi:unnamed protein product, partial [Nesidiocoris tenuis]
MFAVGEMINPFGVLAFEYGPKSEVTIDQFERPYGHHNHDEHAHHNDDYQNLGFPESGHPIDHRYLPRWIYNHHRESSIRGATHGHKLPRNFLNSRRKHSHSLRNSPIGPNRLHRRVKRDKPKKENKNPPTTRKPMAVSLSPEGERLMESLLNENIIVAPTRRCPSGYRRDPWGKCR